MARIRATASANAIWTSGGVDSAWPVMDGLASSAVSSSRMGQCPGVGVCIHTDFCVGPIYLGSQPLGFQHHRAYADARGIQHQLTPTGRAVPRRVDKRTGLAVLPRRGRGCGHRGHFVDTRTAWQVESAGVYVASPVRKFKVGRIFTYAAAAYNLVRMRNLAIQTT